MKLPIYLDFNATTPLLPEVVDAMLPFLREHHGNPSSGHAYGRRAKEAVEAARCEVAALLGARPHEIVFTSGGTEANNLAIAGVAAARSLTKNDRREIVTSAIEHPATANPCAALERVGWRVHRVPVGADGRVRARDVLDVVSDRTALVTIMHSNNETGVLQPIGELAATRSAGALVHTDAAQSVGKVPIDVGALGVDLLSIAGHKLYAPKGVGALYVREGVPIEPVLRGAGHERGLRPGTENVASIVGLGVACVIARRDGQETFARIRERRDRLHQRLRSRIPGLVLHGHSEERLPNTLNVGFPGVSGSRILDAASAVAASTGSACHDGHESPSAVLVAMGIEPRAALAAVRLTLGRTTTNDDVDQAAAALAAAYDALRRAS